MKKASEDPALQKYLGYTDEQVVSTDFIKNTLDTLMSKLYPLTSLAALILQSLMLQLEFLWIQILLSL